MKFNIIVAMDNNRGIGLNNQLPWSFKEDITYFKNLTKGAGNNAIIMGKNTYHSINKELPHRDNIILSTTLTQIPENMFLCKSIKEIFDLVQNKQPSQSDAKTDSSLLDIEYKHTPTSFHDRKCVTWPAKSSEIVTEKIGNDDTVFNNTSYSQMHLQIPTRISKDSNYDDIWIIGGSSIYKQFLDMPEYIDKIFITYIDNNYSCDSFFPELPDYYELVNSSISNEKHILLTFNMYKNMFVSEEMNMSKGV
jgi:dihydrofolate reductase